MNNKFRRGRRRILRAGLTLLAAALFPRFYQAAADDKVIPSHHVPGGGFRNNFGRAISKPFSDLMKWRRESPGHPLLSFPLAENDTEFLQQNRTQNTLTWIGHATFLLQADGMNVITDPHFSKRASPVSFAGPERGTPPGISIDDLPSIDVVLISHNHYDHLDSDSIKALAKKNPQTQFLCPLGLEGFLTSRGAKIVHELDWGESVEWQGARFIAEPCHHWSSRFPWDRNKTLWASWVWETAEKRFLFIGDTGYSQDFVALGEKYGGFDWAMIPIGAYEPRWFMKEAHINPEESLKIFSEVRAKTAFASHWGTFQLTDEPMDEPPQKLRESLPADADNFHVLAHGETRILQNAG